MGEGWESRVEEGVGRGINNTKDVWENHMGAGVV